MGVDVDTRLFWGFEFSEDQMNDDSFGEDPDELASRAGVAHVRLGDTYAELTGDFVTVTACLRKTYRWGQIDAPRPPTEEERQRMVAFLNSILRTEIPEDKQPVLILGHIVA